MVILVLAIGLFAGVAYRDVRTGRIPNRLALAIGALGLVRMILAGDTTAGFYTLAAAAAVFAVACLLFRRGLVGGGDVKLLTAATLLVGYRDLAGLLLVMSLCGALIALVVVAADRLAPRLRSAPRAARSPPVRADRGSSARLTVPYGVAIAAAGILTLLLQSNPRG
jgi:prepilin peptidase CpaA